MTEFYLLGEDGLRIFGEVENVGPGLTRDLVVLAAPGEYRTACQPGMVGGGIRADFTVTDSGADLTPTGPMAGQVEAATDAYAAYVRDQTEQLVADTDAFVAAYLAGDDERARDLYAPTRMHCASNRSRSRRRRRPEARRARGRPGAGPGLDGTGWHRIEKDLWPPGAGHVPLTEQERASYADLLAADNAELYERLPPLA